ncbi:hypothetical protein [Terrimonas pollutisoli]|uniref:hypothetical protein n=1 Tax=Terrimonas pollutisoli TaxID=3034147 RepID=UPI0023ED31FE|nr:hypothetical protein [Terrimonas sp. H1YJ31]
MKKQIKIYFLLTTIILAGTIAVNAQQKKASDITFEEEMKKVNEKRAARYNYINKIRQSTPVESQAPRPADQNINTGAGTASTSAPSAANQAPANLKPSQQVMRAPKKPL